MDVIENIYRVSQQILLNKSKEWVKSLRNKEKKGKIEIEWILEYL